MTETSDPQETAVGRSLSSAGDAGLLGKHQRDLRTAAGW